KQVAYLAPSQDKTGLFLYDLEAKKSELLVELEASDHFLGHEADRRFAWSPDGRSIAYLALEPGPAPTQPAPALAGVKVLERILYKTRTGFSPNRPLEVWLVATSGPARGQAKRLTEGAFDHHSLAWAPDGKRLLFSSNQAPDPDAHYADDLFWVDVASGALSRLTDTPGPELHPAVSPDGSKVAYLAMSRAISTRDSPAEDLQLWVMPSAGGTGVELSASLDRRVTEIAWEPGGDSLLFVAEDQGRKPIYRVKLPQGEAPATIERVLDGFFQASALSLDEKGKTVAYLKTDMTHPGEVFATQIKALRTGQVTQENRALMSLIKPANADTFWSTNADGTRVQTWLMKPLGFRPTERYPAV
ncbi:MAG TPA: hypothetical protein PK413_21320, partial [Thermoanaerobaculia bacterium]|nr:hypothetical protein [Thermoanaerobaculia bacterium]